MRAKELVSMSLEQLADAAEGLKRELASLIRADATARVGAKRAMQRDYSRVLTILAQKKCR